MDLVWRLVYMNVRYLRNLPAITLCTKMHRSYLMLQKLLLHTQKLLQLPEWCENLLLVQTVFKFHVKLLGCQWQLVILHLCDIKWFPKYIIFMSALMLHLVGFSYLQKVLYEWKSHLGQYSLLSMCIRKDRQILVHAFIAVLLQVFCSLMTQCFYHIAFILFTKCCHYWRTTRCALSSAVKNCKDEP